MTQHSQNGEGVEVIQSDLDCTADILDALRDLFGDRDGAEVSATSMRQGAKGRAAYRPISHIIAAYRARLATPSPDSGERMRAYYEAVEPMVCVWAGTNTPSSMDEEAWEQPNDDPDSRWEKFIAARAALQEPAR
jgi:hypothetical protein